MQDILMRGPIAAIWFAVPAILMVVGLAMLLSGLVYLCLLRPLRAGGNLVFGGIFALAGAALGLVGLNLQTYSRLSYESSVAEIDVAKRDPAHKLYTVTVHRLDGSGRTQSCELQGDEWLLSGRVQKWQPWVNVVGIDATYTLDQIANKYFNAAEANGKPITACSIETPAPDVNRYLPAPLLERLMSYVQIEDRRFGSANYMPLADGATYIVVMTRAGLNAEPTNAKARAANAKRP